MKTWEENAIEKIMEKFDFQKVKKTMDALGWKYALDKETPTIEELKKVVLELLNESIKFAEEPEYQEEKQFSMFTGGFRVDYERNVKIILSFEITSTQFTNPDFHNVL